MKIHLKVLSADISYFGQISISQFVSGHLHFVKINKCFKQWFTEKYISYMENTYVWFNKIFTNSEELDIFFSALS